ncbi:MAG: putative glycoside hydrolase [Candidatus Paceibacterota bacterium]
MEKTMHNKKFINFPMFLLFVLIIASLFVYFIFPKLENQIEFNSEEPVVSSKILDNKENTTIAEVVIPKEIIPVINPIVVTHVDTPKVVKAVYVSAWVAGSPKFRDSIIKMIDDTELNAIVIDVKDSTGRVSFDMAVPAVQKEGSIEKRISNIRALTNMLHEKNVYIIGRVSVFQDPYMTKKHPEMAVTKKSDGTVWEDRKGLSFLDPAKKEVHDYILAVAKGAYDEGFDEINFDYIRYPSDGNMKDINYHLTTGETRSDNIEKFFKYLSTEMKKEKNIPISADLFGLTTEAMDDMGIGQVWEKALPYFDFLCPMVYPSHYPAGHMGYKNPNAYPYEVINQALVSAIKKTDKVSGDKNKIRAWLQDFDMGTIYTKEMVQKEFKAVYDNDLTSWMLWDPANKYTPSALELEVKQ